MCVGIHSSVIEKAKDACKGSNIAISDHFVDVNKMVKAGVSSKPISDIAMTRYGCYTELAANLFRATQTEEKLRRDNVQGKQQANRVHYQVGAKVRQTIKDLGGTMPEDLPTPEKSIKQIEKEKKKLKD